MAVAHDHATRSGAANFIGSTSFNHTPVGTPQSASLITFEGNTTTDNFTSATYGGVSFSTNVAWLAKDTAGEVGVAKLWHVGSGISSGTQSVALTCASVTDGWAVVMTQTASGATEIHGIVLVQEDGTLSEISVDDGSPGSNSQRYAAGYFGLNTPPSVGANSTSLFSLDDGTWGFAVARETTAGQGSRSVGFSSGSADDRAVIGWAVREVSGGGGGGGNLAASSYYYRHLSGGCAL